MGLDAVDIYGLSEVMGPGVAQECIETKDGLTIWEDHFYPEIVDPATGEPMPDGQPGELVFTSLTKEALPVIRYRTRDLTAPPPRHRADDAPDGRITGRSDDMLIIRGVNVFPTQIEELITKQPRLSPHYFLEVRREGRLDELAVIVEARADAAAPPARPSAPAKRRRSSTTSSPHRRLDQGEGRGAGQGRALAGQGEAGGRPSAEGLAGPEVTPSSRRYRR